MRGATILAVFAIFALFSGLLAPPLCAEETRAANIDVILLIDKSLSMRDAEAAVRRYAAGNVIGPVILPGDRLIIETFYGQIDRLYAGTIRSEGDKAAIVRSLDGVAPDGKFTDIGAALDRAEADLAELGMPEREKYVLLLTDERQEAPYGSKYISTDYILRHPALEYVKRVDLGAFRAITVGFGVGKRVDDATTGVMRLLSDPPARRGADFSNLPESTSPGLDGAAEAAESARSAAAQGSGAQGAGNAGDGPGVGTVAFIAGGLLFAVLLAVALSRIVKLRKSHGKDAKPDDHR